MATAFIGRIGLPRAWLLYLSLDDLREHYARSDFERLLYDFLFRRKGVEDVSQEYQ